MLTTKNLNAETAYAMALKLIDNPSEEVSKRIWDKCHADKAIQDAVSLYLYSTFDYAPKALYKLHTKLVELVQSV